MNIYVASSWKNVYQSQVVRDLRNLGHEVYDFRDEDGFNWRQIDPYWVMWSLDQYKKGLQHELAVKGFNRDFEAMKITDACVLLMPCGNSAHLEAGWFIGQGKPVYILLAGTDWVPELMYKMANGIYTSLPSLLSDLEKLK